MQTCDIPAGIVGKNGPREQLRIEALDTGEKRLAGGAGVDGHSCTLVHLKVPAHDSRTM